MPDDFLRERPDVVVREAEPTEVRTTAWRGKILPTPESPELHTAPDGAVTIRTAAPADPTVTATPIAGGGVTLWLKGDA